MNSLHVNSPCCQGMVVRFGRRRRQCCICKRTWRIRLKKRGRHSLRISSDLASRYIDGTYHFKSNSRLSYGQFKYRLRKSRDKVLAQAPLSSLPDSGPYLLLVDAKIQQVRGRYFTTYLVLIRSIRSSQASIYRVSTLPGYENGVTWTSLLVEQMPPSLKGQIKAIICDGARIFPVIAQQNGWLLQRCHFHLLAILHSQLTGWKLGKRQARLGLRLRAHIHVVLTSTDEHRVQLALKRLRFYRSSSEVSDTVRRRVLNGFIIQYQDYRTYLKYPELQLPRTNNSCESFIRVIHSFFANARGVSSAKALERWIQMVCTRKSSIKCRGTTHQPN